MIAADQIPNVVPSGKFLSRLGNKFFLKAMRIEAGDDSANFDQKIALRRRFDALRAAHTTALIVGSQGAEPVLDAAEQAGLYALVEIEVPIESLLSRAGFRPMVSRIVEKIRSLRCYPAVIGYLLDCQVEPTTLRHHGLERLKRRLTRLVAAIRRYDDRRMVAIKHRPATIGLATLDEDLIYAVMPPLSPSQLRSYVVRLHNLAEARPVVLEFGEGLADQDDMVSCAFGLGAAGVVAPAIPPKPLSHGSLAIKMLSAGELLPFVTLNGSCPPKPVQTPMVSVVICAYNAERTMRPCLESLRRLDYPNFEVIIVDDGSRDATAAISADFPEFRLIRQPNKGLSVARNVGLHAARGEIVAYTDSDCVVDPHWLTLMVRAMNDSGFDGCGGPNYAPHEEGWVERCVAASPGAPCHVLIGDDRAEHLAGCNMIYRKDALLEVGGFDPRFTAAGDDVDICWRLIDSGRVLGFCPAAFVWHFRRNTVKAYYGQQRGYGKAEAMLYFKYPERFNAIGQIRWNGTIPGLARTLPGGAQQRVGWSRRIELLQRVYEAPLSLIKVAPMTAEWTFASAALLMVTFMLGITIIPALAMLAAGPLWALHYARKAPLEKAHDGLLARLFIAWLAYSGPITRTITRYRSRKNGGKGPLFDAPARQRPAVDWLRRSIRLSYWNDAYTTRDSMLERIAKFFTTLNRPVITDSGWQDFDLRVEADSWTRIEFRTADEELSGMKIRTNVAARLRLSKGVRLGLGGCAIAAAATAAAGLPLAAAILGILTAGGAACAISELVENGRLAYRAIEQCGVELNLVPLGKPTKAASEAPVPAVAPPEAENAVNAATSGN